MRSVEVKFVKRKQFACMFPDFWVKSLMKDLNPSWAAGSSGSVLAQNPNRLERPAEAAVLWAGIILNMLWLRSNRADPEPHGHCGDERGVLWLMHLGVSDILISWQ